MFKTNWQEFLKKVSNDDEPARRRKFPRRENDVCVIEIDGQNYPVKDWSMGGALIEVPNADFNLGENITFMIKFKLKDRVLEVEHSATVVRISKAIIALEFTNLTSDARTEFNRVIDDTAAALNR